MSTPNTDIAARVSQLERTLIDELARLRDDSWREQRTTDHRNIRLCKTISDADSYPSSPADTFEIEFLDSFFSPRQSGTRIPTHTARGEDSRDVGHNLTGDFLAEGTICFALWQQGLEADGAAATDGQWWIERTSGGGAGSGNLYVVWFTLDSTLALGGTATATIGASCNDNVASLVGGSSITVQDRIGKFKGQSGYKGAAYRYASDTSCTWTIIELEEQAEVIQATLAAGFVSGATTGTVNDYWQGKSPGLVANLADPCDHYSELKAGDCVIASYDEILDVYNVIDGAQALAASEKCEAVDGRGVLADMVGWSIVELAGDKDFPIKHLQLNRDTCMRGFHEPLSNTLLIGIDPSTRANSILWSGDTDAGDHSVRWTDGPKIGHHVTVGGNQAAADGDSYVAIKGSPIGNAGGLWTLAVGAESYDSSQVWLMPSNHPDKKNTHIVVEKTGEDNSPATPECLQLKWTAQGKDGSFEVPTGFDLDVDFVAQTATLTITNSCLVTLEAGIVSGIEAKSETINLGCNDDTVEPTHNAACDIEEADEQDPCAAPNG